MIRIAPTRKQCRQAFTLVELLLVVALVLALTSALVFNFTNLMKGNQLAEGTTRLETLLRFARAQAANSGKKVQLVFETETTNAAASTGEVRATWEPDPLGQPGCFSSLEEAQWHVRELNDCVQVERVKLLDPTGASPAASTNAEDDSEEVLSAAAPAKPMAPITFYPDGSSDSAEIIVASKSPEEDQRMAVRLVGLTGSISHQLVSADPDEVLSEAEQADRYSGGRRDGVVRDLGTDQDSGSRTVTKMPAATSSRTLSSSPRSPVGETNTVDQAE